MMLSKQLESTYYFERGTEVELEDRGLKSRKGGYQHIIDFLSSIRDVNERDFEDTLYISENEEEIYHIEFEVEEYFFGAETTLEQVLGENLMEEGVKMENTLTPSMEDY